jgi:hypothetical protein
LDEFLNLQSLILITVRQDNVEKLRMMLPLIPQLFSLRLIESPGLTGMIITRILMSKLQTLALQQFWVDLEPDDTIHSITSLTLSYEILDRLYELLKNLPMLKYLNCSVIEDYPSRPTTRIDLGDYRSIHLKQLVMMKFECCFDELEMFMKYTPNLKILTISADNNEEMIDAYRWENLITSSLPQLAIFKFKFSCSYEDDILRKFEQFQTHFWHEEHHWYTDYECDTECKSLDYSAQIFTVPYISNTYVLK